MNLDPEPAPIIPSFETIEAELRAFEKEERARLGLVEEEILHWTDGNPQQFARDQRDSTTILVGGLTLAHDTFVSAALNGLGYRLEPLPCPDLEALRVGKEFGNRGQCNPTYFTVGGLVKHLIHLRDEQKIPVQEIVTRYVFMTAGACGPCRFGMYATEYRKALRDAGFDGFRVLLFQQQGGLRQATGPDSAVEYTPAFFRAVVRAIIAGDVLNAAGYRIRPYEVKKGATDAALAECRTVMADAFRRGKSAAAALWRCGNILNTVAVDRLQPKPKVSVIGEFWAMTTEGDGNYRLQRFLEQEGAEVDVQPVTAWLLYNIWEHSYDTRRRLTLPVEDAASMGLAGSNPRKKLALLWGADKALRAIYAVFARALGLGHVHLADMEEIATISHSYYDNHLRGGEGHMEVGKLIKTARERKAHLVISVKPFGCMPSSGVSDGVQSLVTARHPDAAFLAIETTGDGEVNVQSRVQLDLFKARRRAEEEFKKAVEGSGKTLEELKALAKKRGRGKALWYPAHTVAGTGANTVVEIAGKRVREAVGVG
ncbi:MAG: 2-hydroxyglutaryl-CoA dehydratase [Candidatus Brocadiae bacterium]|nr:2-hydroxyglutaryl-CoA dehydratase [Candidatus Brocadiia bacterium]